MRKLIITIVALFPYIGLMPQADSYNNYPVPSGKNILFYLQRNLNRNTIIYELNTLPGGEINNQQPVSVYWIRYEEGGERKELSSIQQMVFGLNIKLANEDSGIYVLNFKKHKSKDIYLIKDNKTSNYKAYIEISGNKSCLQRIFIQLKNNFFSLKPEIKHIDISGVSIKDNKLITERFIP